MSGFKDLKSVKNISAQRNDPRAMARGVSKHKAARVNKFLAKHDTAAHRKIKKQLNADQARATEKRTADRLAARIAAERAPLAPGGLKRKMR